MAKRVQKLSLRYARALLRAVERSLGKLPTPDTGAVSPAEHLAAELKAFATSWDANESLREALLSPLFPKVQRARALEKILESVKINTLLAQGIKLLFEKDRLSLLSEVAQGYTEMAEKAAGVIQIEITTARNIETDERTHTEASLRKLISARSQFKWTTDVALIGGMKIEYSGKVIDASLNGGIGRVERELFA
ncbi:ATP synthase F1 subunit delta [bacterium]|nr:ATP synthase F1 subunit delta [bacterium]